jgi:hypothetical protein
VSNAGGRGGGGCSLVACGGGGGSNDGTAESATKALPLSPPQQRAALAVIDEQRADGRYDLLLVNLHSGARKLLDHGSGGYDGSVIAGNRVVFTRDGDLFVVGTDGSGRLQLTAGPGIDVVQALVSDRVVFQRTLATADGTDEQDDVYSVRLDGSDEQVLSGDPNRDEFVLRVIGDLVVFSSRGLDFENSDLHARRVDASAPVTALAVSTFDEGLADVVGQRVVIETFIEAEDGSRHTDLHSRRLDGTGLVALADTASEERYAGALGERIFINMSTSTPQGFVRIVNAVNTDGSERVSPLLSDAPVRAVVNGRLIFERDVTGAPQLFSVAATGADVATQLTSAAQQSVFRAAVGDTLKS